MIELKKNIAKILKKQQETSFKKEGFEGAKWKKLKVPKRPKKPILVETRRLVKSFRTSIRRNVIRLYTNVPYATRHNEGEPSRNLPQRQMIGVTDDLKKDINKECNEYFKKHFKRSFKFGRRTRRI